MPLFRAPGLRKGACLALALGAASCANLSAHAADTAQAAIASAVKQPATEDEFYRAFWRDAKITVHARSYFDGRAVPVPPNPRAWAVGGWVGYESGWYGDFFRVGAVGYTSQPLWAPRDGSGTSLLKSDQTGYGVIGEAYVALKLWNQVLTGYRQRINEPEVNARDNSKMTPNTFEGVSLAGKVGDFSYIAAYLDAIKVVNEDNFQNFGTVAGAPRGINRPMWVGTLRYEPVETFTARLSSYQVPDILMSTYSDAAWTVPVADRLRVKLGGQFMYQSSIGSNLLTGAAFDAWVGGPKADLIYGALTATIGYTMAGRGANYRTPYGSWAGYTSMIVKDFNRAGETALLVGAAVDFATFNLPGLVFTTNLAFGGNAINPATKARVSDNNEYDFTLDYRFTAKHWPDWLKPLWIRARAAHVEERLAGAVRVTNDYRLISNYEWKF